MRAPSAHREWVDWTQPLAPAAARWLLQRGSSQRAGSSRSNTCELDHAICVTPGKRAGRVILESLLRECESQGVSLLPPRFITPGALLEALAPCKGRSIASPEDSRMTWIRALQDADPETLRPLLPATLAASRDVLQWNALAKIIQDLHDELAGAMLTFADVADRAARLELFGETNRWLALAHIHKRYLEILAGANLHDAHQSRFDLLTKAQGLPSLGALANREPPRVFLIGVTELNPLQRLALAQANNITALIHAPPELSAAFDDLGCVVTDTWTDRTLALRDEQIIIADQPDDQAQAALHQLAASHQNAPTDTITIGLGDDSLGEPLQRAADWAKLNIHRAEAITLAQTAPFRLLEAYRDWIAEKRFAPFAALLRHSDVERWLLSQHQSTTSTGSAIQDWLTLLDRYFTDHLHKRFIGDWLGEPETRTRLKRIHDALHSLAPSLHTRESRPLSHWIPPTLEILQQVCFTASPSHHQSGAVSSSDACLAIRDALEPFALIDESLQPTCDAATALTLFLDACASASLSTQPRDNQIEVLGWLELHLDAAPNLIVMGVNDGNIPKSITSDAFLPNSLREALGLQSNSSRYARDAYLLEAINRSRNVILVAGRRGPEGDPLAPSRLLFACDEAVLPHRVLRLADEKMAFHGPIPMGAPPAASMCDFKVYQAPSSPYPLTRMRVTAFRQYLQCPLRWYLANELDLKSIGDAADELDPLTFGTLAHEVLQLFGTDEAIRDSTNADEIHRYLTDRLARIASETYGDHPPPAIRIQLDRLAHRLAGFARFQAKSRAEGWRIIECEFKLRDCQLDIPGDNAITVTGTIDRIDRHEASSACRIIDYKTGDRGDSPMRAHHGKEKYDGEWLDLQLPLYRHLAPQCLDLGDNVELGYFNLPKDADAAGFCAADWTPEQLDEAIEKAREVVRNIRAGIFPMSAVYDSAFDDFANICQTNVLGRASRETEAEAQP